MEKGKRFMILLIIVVYYYLVMCGVCYKAGKGRQVCKTLYIQISDEMSYLGRVIINYCRLEHPNDSKKRPIISSKRENDRRQLTTCREQATLRWMDLICK